MHICAIADFSAQVLNPDFYTSIATRSDLGFADAVIDGHVKVSMTLVNFFSLFVCACPT